MNIGQYVRLSVDDVIGCFRWIYKARPDSIFEEPMLAKIKEWHEQYNLSCYLYVFEQCDRFSLEQVQDCYWKELEKERTWLRIGWHRRKAGPLSDTDEAELASLARTYHLVKEKAAVDLWADKIRLHRWEASKELLRALEKTGVRMLLTPDSERQCYQLDETESSKVWEEGYLEKDAFAYRKTELRLDKLAGETTVDECCNYVEALFKKRLWHPCVECFFHEWKFETILSEIDQFWKNFGKIKIPLFASAGVQVGEQLYFTACNTSTLYKLNQEKQVERIAKLPCKTYNTMKFSDLVFYKDCIWMIPWYENNIFVYYLHDKRTEIFSISFLREEKVDKSKFRKVVVDNDFLWLLPLRTACVLRIDMRCYAVDIFSEWPEGVKFADNRTMNFKMMTQYGNKLYLFKDGCTHNIAVDMESGELSIWDIDLTGAFGIFLGKNKLLLSPVKRCAPVQLIDMQTMSKKVLPVPNKVWQEGKGYAFWYSKRIGDVVYIFPHEAKAVMCYDAKTGELAWHETGDVDYCTLRSAPSFAMYDVFQIKGEELLFPYMGNTVLLVDQNGQKVRKKELFEELQKKERHYERKTAYENKRYALTEYLDELKNHMQSEWTSVRENGNVIVDMKAQHRIGRKIHREMKSL